MRSYPQRERGECLPGLRPNPTSLVPSQLDSIFNIPAGKDNLPGLRPNPTSLVPSQLDSIFNIPAGKDNLPRNRSAHSIRRGRHPPKVIGSPLLFNANRLKRSTAFTEKSLAVALRDTRNPGTRSGGSVTHKSMIPTGT